MENVWGLISESFFRWRIASAHYECLFSFSRWFPRRLPLLCALLLLMRVDAQEAPPQNGTREVEALMNFRVNSLEDTDAFGNLDTWDATDENPCAWVGVICTLNITVEELNLSGWGLIRLSSVAYLSGLLDLRRIYLSSNNIASSIPDDFGGLTKLTHLDLSQNMFDGFIAASITSCLNLRYLNLAQNQLIGEIPNLSSLVHLQVLSLENNNLTGSFPNGLGEISGLLNVDLSDNLLEGIIPSLSNLTQLRTLSLDHNNFTSFEEPFVPFTGSLEQLLVSGNQLEGPIPPGMNVGNLEVLKLSNNRLTGEIPDGLAVNVNHSFQLDLSQNLLNGTIPIDLLQYSRVIALIVSMNLSNNYLSGNIPAIGGNYDFVDLSHNQLTGVAPFTNTTGGINILSLQNNMLSGDIFYSFLNNSPTQYTLQSISELRLQNNLFTGDLSRLVNSTNIFNEIGILDLSNNNLRMSTTEAAPDPWRPIFESALASYCGLTEFRVGGNNFSGTSLPAGYDSSYMCAPGNTQFPQGALISLEVLDLSNNHLEGQISGEVFNSSWFPNLQILNFSNNRAIGDVPESTLQLPNLVVLNVSYNKLSGRLPIILQNSSLYNPAFFEGNALCGDPLPPCLCGDSLSPCPAPGPDKGPAISPSIRNGNIQWWVYLIIGFSVLIAFGSCLGLLVATLRWRMYQKRHQQDVDLIKALVEREAATLMHLRDLKKATNNFAESAQIGEGGFGIVYIGKLIDGTRVAIKRSKREESEKNKEQFLNEVRILSQVNHRNLVKLLGCCLENKVALLVFEFVSNGTLQEHLLGKGGLNLGWKQRLKIAVQTADALNYLHMATTCPIYHRDVKSVNILLDEDLNAKVADFGISKLAPIEATHVSTIAIQGTMGYIDPEYYTSYQLTDRSDVYSFGVVLLELISAKPAIDFRRGGTESSLVYFAKPFIEAGDLQQLIDPNLVEIYNDPIGRESLLNVGRLAIKCLDMQSKARPKMNEVWIELQTLLHELDHKSNDWADMSEDYSKDSQDNSIFLSR